MKLKMKRTNKPETKMAKKHNRKEKRISGISGTAVTSPDSVCSSFQLISTFLAQWESSRSRSSGSQRKEQTLKDRGKKERPDFVGADTNLRQEENL